MLTLPFHHTAHSGSIISSLILAVPSYYKVHPHQVGRNGDHANDLVDDLLGKQQPPATDSANLDTTVNTSSSVNY